MPYHFFQLKPINIPIFWKYIINIKCEHVTESANLINLLDK